MKIQEGRERRRRRKEEETKRKIGNAENVVGRE